MKVEITHHRFDDGAHAFDYILHRKPRLKHRYIRIRDGQPVISASTRTSAKTLEAFIAEHATWIIRQLKNTADKRIDLTQPDATVYWRGTRVPIVIQSGTRMDLALTHNAATFTLITPPTHATLLTLLHAHYKTHAPSHILPRVDHWAAIMNLHPTHVGFRRARTRWGSCSARNRLSLNTHLMMLPDDLIDYVVVHELAHIRHKNHSKDFWNLVETYVSDWRQRRKSMRHYEKYLH